MSEGGRVCQSRAESLLNFSGFKPRGVTYEFVAIPSFDQVEIHFQSFPAESSKPRLCLDLPCESPLQRLQGFPNVRPQPEESFVYDIHRPIILFSENSLMGQRPRWVEPPQILRETYIVYVRRSLLRHDDQEVPGGFSLSGSVQLKIFEDGQLTKSKAGAEISRSLPLEGLRFV